jgi:hypothetical protein
LLVLGGILATSVARRRRTIDETMPLTEAERAELEALK